MESLKDARNNATGYTKGGTMFNTTLFLINFGVTFGTVLYIIGTLTIFNKPEEGYTLENPDY